MKVKNPFPKRVVSRKWLGPKRRVTKFVDTAAVVLRRSVQFVDTDPVVIGQVQPTADATMDTVTELPSETQTGACAKGATATKKVRVRVKCPKHPGYRKERCKPCNAGRCKHGRCKYLCSECGTATCKHGRQKSQCKKCDTGHCEHNHRKGQCHQCNTGHCEHGQRKSRCKECKTGHCEHGHRKDRCTDCHTVEELMAKPDFCSICGVTSLTRNRRLTSGMCAGCDSSKQRTTQQIVLDMLLPLVPPPSAIDNVTIGGAACNTDRRRPDTGWVGTDRVLLIENDEQSHEEREIACELAKNDSSRFGLQGGGVDGHSLVPVIILRFNPDACDRPVPNLQGRVARLAELIHFYLTCPLSMLCPHRVNLHYCFYGKNGRKHIDAALGKPETINVLAVE
jgi:hypothetical protein